MADPHATVPDLSRRRHNPEMTRYLLGIASSSEKSVRTKQRFAIVMF